MYKMVTYELRLVRDIAHGGRALARRIASILEPRLAAVKADLRDLPGSWLELFQLALIGLVEQDAEQTTAAEKVLVAERREEKRLRRRRQEAKKSSTVCCSKCGPSWRAP